MFIGFFIIICASFIVFGVYKLIESKTRAIMGIEL